MSKLEMIHFMILSGVWSMVLISWIVLILETAASVRHRLKYRGGK